MAKQTVGGVNLGAYLHSLRLAAGLTQMETERRAGLPQDEVSRWERGIVKELTVDKQRRFAHAYGVDVAYIAMANAGVNPAEFRFPELQDRRLSTALWEFLQHAPNEVEARLALDHLLMVREWMRMQQRGEFGDGTSDIHGADERHSES